MREVKKILVVRNDKIGDFVLALPAIKTIKLAFPNAEITALVPNYTKEIAESFRWIDKVIIDPKDKENKAELAETLKAENFDAVLCLFSNSYNASVMRSAKIPVRVAPATKLAQFLYTKTLRQRRSKSKKPEFQYNIELADYFIKVLGGEIPDVDETILSFSNDELKQQVKKLEAIGVDFSKKRCFIHPVTGGSSNTLTTDQWVTLASYLDRLDDFHFVVTAGPGEEEASKAVCDALQGKVKHVSLYDKNDGVKDFMRSIALASLFIAGSTGPLHIAGALDVPTIGFYPKKRSSTPLRWQTLNTNGRWLPFSPNDKEQDLPKLDVTSRLREVALWYRSLSK